MSTIPLASIPTPPKSSSNTSSSSSNIPYGVTANGGKNQQQQNGYNTSSISNLFFSNKHRHQSHYHHRSLNDHFLNDKHRFFIIYLFPLFILLNLGLRIWSIIVVITKMRAQILYKFPNNPEKHQIFEMYISDFSFPEMMRDFWDAKAYVAALLIAFGSAVFPILKHILMIVSWYLPISADNESKRRHILFLFDQFGRVSFVDLFFLCFVVRIFYTDMTIDLFGVKLEASLNPEPVYGIFIGLVSTAFLTFISHIMLILHDKQQFDYDSDRLTIASGPPTASFMYRMYCATNRSWNFRWATILGTSFLFVATVFVAVVTLQKDMVSFELAGAVGDIASKFDGRRYFSIYTLGSEVPNNTDKAAGAGFVVTLYMILVFGFPTLLFLISVALWVLPLSVMNQRKILAVFPYLHSWCGLDILLATTFACFVNMHLIGEFTLKQKFDKECKLIRSVVGMDCIDLKHELEEGFYWFLALAILHEGVFLLTNGLGVILLEKVDTSFFGANAFGFGVDIGSINGGAIGTGNDLTSPIYNHDGAGDGYVVSTHAESEMLQNSPFAISARSWLRESSIGSDADSEDDDRNSVNMVSSENVANRTGNNGQTSSSVVNPIL